MIGPRRGVTWLYRCGHRMVQECSGANHVSQEKEDDRTM